MKFVHYLDKITNINIYAFTSFGIFAFVFIVMLVYVFKTDKKTFQEISRIPLD
ncbi:MAG: CcoQ/FixQ family Cbb3-type cytochrome c oxidase assembly chaperone [Chitinophagaceae bacterium]|nr:CcoQ/FixQ family Cbb3-type cytochrome c oxidase assembly chaperone [Chitinophagaceae bacterium]